MPQPRKSSPPPPPSLPEPAIGGLREQDLVARILLVDDHPPNLVALEAILDPLGQELVHAHSGKDALRRLLDSDFALILMDVQMPGLDGIETAKAIKERSRNRHIPIIFLTAIHKDPSYIFRGYAEGAVDYLLKPFDPEILRAKVRVFVDLWRKTELIRSQQALLRAQEVVEVQRKSEIRYRALTDSMPQMVWAAQADGTVYFCNQVWREYVGPDVGMDFVEALPAEERADALESYRSAVRTGGPFEREQRLLRYDGQLRWHLCRMVPERGEHGRIIGWILTATDIDQQKRVEQANQELLRSEKEARQLAEVANRMKDEFLATVSHELRTPLNAILGWTRMLRTGAVDARQQGRVLETIERNARAQTQLVEDILDVSRIIAGKLRVAIQKIDLHAVARSAMDAVRPAADAKGVELAADLEPESADFVGDPDRLQQVIWNLLSNAIKFTPRGGRVGVHIARESSDVVIRVQDTGMGIAADFLPLVFDRFRQADSSITRAQGGLGLGLAIVRHLVEVHGGTVQAHSAGEGLGSTFVVRMPVRAVAPLEPQLADRTPREMVDGVAMPALSLAGVEVLVVDDEADARELVSAVLTRLGAVVRAASTAQEALQLLREKVPDVLLSDIGLPAEDGYALIRKIRMLEGDISRVSAAALTAYAGADDHRRAIDAGFQAHVAKPIEPAQLALLVARLTGRAAGANTPPPGPQAAAMASGGGGAAPPSHVSDSGSHSADDEPALRVAAQA